MSTINPFSLIPLIATVLCCSLGLMVFLVRKSSPLAGLFATLCYAVCFWTLSLVFSLNSSDPSYITKWSKFGHLTCTVGPAIFLQFIFRLYRFQSKLSKVVCGAYYCFAVATGVMMVSSDIYFTGEILSFSWGYYAAPGPLLYMDCVAGIGACLFAYYVILNRKRLLPEGLAEGELNRINYLNIAIVLFSLAMVDYLPKFGVPIPPIGSVFLIMFFSFSAYAILKHQLMDIRIVIRKGLVYSLLVGLMTAGFMAVVLVMERWFQGFMGYQSIVASAVVAFAVAIFFNPLRERIQSWVDKALFKGTAAELSEQREQLLGEVQKSEHMRSVGTLAAGLAHEIKNPLTAIKTFTEYLPERWSDPDYRERFENIVGSEVERIRHIVQQLLDFSKPLPLSEIVEETLELLNNDLVSKKIRLQRSLNSRAVVCADAKQIKQVILNLVLNAMDAMPEGGTLWIRISRESARSRGHDDRSEAHESCPRIKSRDLVILTIEDTGHGMQKAQLKQSFDPFFTTKSSGTGLGLSVVRRIIEEHDGQIGIRSQPGRGTRVTIKLPRAARAVGSEVRQTVVTGS